ncbi:hypothetical protein QS257_18195 [Terrilactibacillus sp. S3-3]|nr:hypothetical protein QS257_18195 [Terrilactibacillus sp. S3-3]
MLADVLDGYFSLESAAADFGVVIQNGEIDWDETNKLRSGH